MVERVVALQALQVLVEGGVEAVRIDAEGVVAVERAPGLFPVLDVLEGAVKEGVGGRVGLRGHVERFLFREAEGRASAVTPLAWRQCRGFCREN
jgi:hypothetical protein